MQSESHRPSESLLEIRNLKTYFRTENGMVRAVDDVDVMVAAGETVCIVGESGCGKTATAHSVLKLIPTPPGEIVGGQILYRGQDLVRLDDPTHFLAIAGFSYDESTRTATWTTAAPLAAGRYLLGLSADVKDKHDRPLDGEWQASAEFPSGDGQAGGNFRLGFSVLPGDADRSGRIGLDDFGLLRGAFGEPSTFVDFGGNGSVDLDDFAVLKQNFGQRLPRTAFEGLGEQEALQALDDLVHEQAAGLPEENESELQALLSDLALSHWFED